MGARPTLITELVWVIYITGLFFVFKALCSIEIMDGGMLSSPLSGDLQFYFVAVLPHQLMIYVTPQQSIKTLASKVADTANQEQSWISVRV